MHQLYAFVQVAVACIKVASQAVAAIPTLLFWPLAPFLAICCLVVYWVAVAAYLYSVSSIVSQQLQPSTNGLLSLSVSPILPCCLQHAVSRCAGASHMTTPHRKSRWSHLYPP